MEPNSSFLGGQCIFLGMCWVECLPEKKFPAPFSLAYRKKGVLQFRFFLSPMGTPKLNCYSGLPENLV